MIAWLLLAACGGPATPPPPGPCDLAWAELSTLREGLAAIEGNAVEAPEEGTFKTVCKGLPEKARPCLSPSWSAAHPECDALLADLPRLDARRSPD